MTKNFNFGQTSASVDVVVKKSASADVRKLTSAHSSYRSIRGRSVEHPVSDKLVNNF